jgi:hypothetical protein
MILKSTEEVEINAVKNLFCLISSTEVEVTTGMGMEIPMGIPWNSHGNGNNSQ